jgi:hypothetical protein
MRRRSRGFKFSGVIAVSISPARRPRHSRGLRREPSGVTPLFAIKRRLVPA